MVVQGDQAPTYVSLSRERRLTMLSLTDSFCSICFQILGETSSSEGPV